MKTFDIELLQMTLLYGFCLLAWLLLWLIGLCLRRDIGINILRMSIQPALSNSVENLPACRQWQQQRQAISRD